MLAQREQDGRVDAIEDPLWGSALAPERLPAPWALALTSPVTGAVTAAGGAIGGVPMTPTTKAYGGSVTKQVIGVLAARAVLAGRLRPDASVREALPGLPEWLEPVLTRHLLHHLGALPQPEELAGVLGHPADLAGWSRLGNPDVLAALAACAPRGGTPGRAFSYDNTGYILLAEAVAAALGEPVPDAAAALFGGAGMSASRIGGDPATVLAGAVPPPATIGDGGLWTTATDLLAWLVALNEQRFGADVASLTEAPGALDDGTALDYAWGVGIRPGPVDPTIIHAGSWPGWSAMTIRNRHAGTAVALLAAFDDDERVAAIAAEIHARLLRVAG